MLTFCFAERDADDLEALLRNDPILPGDHTLLNNLELMVFKPFTS